MVGFCGALANSEAGVWLTVCLEMNYSELRNLQQGIAHKLNAADEVATYLCLPWTAGLLPVPH